MGFNMGSPSQKYQVVDKCRKIKFLKISLLKLIEDYKESRKSGREETFPTRQIGKVVVVTGK